MLDAYLEFAEAFPGLLRTDGYPISWRHFVYGLQYIQRERAREALRTANVHAIAAKADEEHWESWTKIQSINAGW